MPESSDITTQVSGEASRVSRSATAGASASRATMSDGPSNRNHTTKGPTASSASSLTTDSKAMASIMPRCCSEACTLRTPNRMVNSAISAATISEVSACTTPGAPPTHGEGAAMVRNDADTACSCSAM